MATYSRILAWRISRTEESGGATVRGIRESERTERLYTHTCTYTHRVMYHLSWDRHILTGTRCHESNCGIPGSQVCHLAKNLPAMREMWVQPLGGEATLEDSMVTHSRILAWRILMDRGAWRATNPRGRKESDRHGFPPFLLPFQAGSQRARESTLEASRGPRQTLS